MIYKKDANFPYPILTNTSNSYENCNFTLDVNLEENTNDYIFEIKYDISSEFITRLLERGQAELILVIKSKDNKFFNLSLETISCRRELGLFKTRFNFSNTNCS